MKKLLCIHGHFYQPPRENPWLDIIEYQPSASPYHDWNEKITRQCYGPNCCARIHDAKGKILKLLSNYEYMSFDFGPTLLSWLEKYHPWVYEKILEADSLSQNRYGGHGNAISQAYNHIIMPMASRRDKITQIRWGIKDFEARFKRKPEGMWLPETAVDYETLELLSKEEIKFTILSPMQAEAIRPIGGKSYDWIDVRGGLIDTKRPYRVFLESGQYIDIFFFEPHISKAVAFEKVLYSGEAFLSLIMNSFDSGKIQLVNIATDGETFGHHFKFGDLALSWLFDHISNRHDIQLINYGYFLELYPPEYEVRIIENTSWSCVHGVKRWRDNCGCNVSHREGWNQAWRRPLRDALNELSIKLANIYEKEGRKIFADPWKARDDYISILLDPSDENKKDFFTRHEVKEEDKKDAMMLLESQRMSMYMFTSCGWFFDDISGIESIQILRYAYRAAELVKVWVDEDIEKRLIARLRDAKSNIPEYGNGERIYKRFVKSARVDPVFVAAGLSIFSLFLDDPLISYPLRHMIKGFDVINDGKKIRGRIIVQDPKIGIEYGFNYWAIKDIPICHIEDSSYGISDLIPDIQYRFFELISDPVDELFLRIIASDFLKQKELMKICYEASISKFNLRNHHLKRRLEEYLIENLRRFEMKPKKESVKEISRLLSLLDDMGMEMDLWMFQNIYYSLLKDKSFIAHLDQDTLRSFYELGKQIGFCL